MRHSAACHAAPEKRRRGHTYRRRRLMIAGGGGRSRGLAAGLLPVGVVFGPVPAVAAGSGGGAGCTGNVVDAAVESGAGGEAVSAARRATGPLSTAAASRSLRAPASSAREASVAASAAGGTTGKTPPIQLSPSSPIGCVAVIPPADPNPRNICLACRRRSTSATSPLVVVGA